MARPDRAGRGRITTAAALFALLAGCGDPAPTPARQAQAPAGDTSSALDSLARETGALPDNAQASPTGSYGRSYEGGSDKLCLVPDGESGRAYRFGAETRFGGEEYCRGEGKARLAGHTLILNFAGAGAGCIIVAQYEGDRVAMPGSLDLRCAALCSDRGSFAGVAFPRIDRDAARARSLSDRNGRPLCR